MGLFFCPPPRVGMVVLKLQKRLAASVMDCGKRKVWLDPNEASEISMANSRQDIRKLIKDGFIIRKPPVIHSRDSFTVLVPSTRDSSPKALHNIFANHTPLPPRPLPPLPPFPPLGRLPNLLASISEAIIKANKHMPKQTLKFILLIYFEAFSNISCSWTGAQVELNVNLSDVFVF